MSAAADAKVSAAIEKAIPTPGVSASGLLGAQAFGQAGIPLDPIVLMNVILPHLKQGTGGYLNGDASKTLIIDALAGAMYTLIRSDSVGQTIKNISKNSLKNFIKICDTGKYPFTNTKGQTYNRNAGYTEATRALYSAMAQLTPQIYDSKMARGFFESKGTDAQCKAAPLCNEYKLGQTICYIHNKPFGEKGQCEHIKPVYDANRHLFLFQTNKSYTSLEQSIMNLEYYWSCNCCNKTKNDDLWFKQENFEWSINDVKLKETLENINNNTKTGKEQCTKKHELVVTNRMTAIKNRYLRHNLAIINAQIAYLQEKIPGNKKNILNARIIYHFISICRILSKVSIDAIKSIDDKIVEKSGAASAPKAKQSAPKKAKAKGGANVNIITQYNKANMIKMQKMHGGMTPEMQKMDILLNDIIEIIFLSRIILEDYEGIILANPEEVGELEETELREIDKRTSNAVSNSSKLIKLIKLFIKNHGYNIKIMAKLESENEEGLAKKRLDFINFYYITDINDAMYILFEDTIENRFKMTAHFENDAGYVPGPNIIPFITQNHPEFDEVNAEILINCIIAAPYLDSYEIFINEEEDTLFDELLKKTFKELEYNAATAERNNVYGNAANAYSVQQPPVNMQVQEPPTRNKNNNNTNKKRYNTLLQQFQEQAEKQKQQQQQQKQQQEEENKKNPAITYITGKRRQNATGPLLIYSSNGTRSLMSRAEQAAIKAGIKPKFPSVGIVKAKRGIAGLNTSQQLTTSQPRSNAAMAVPSSDQQLQQLQQQVAELQQQQPQPLHQIVQLQQQIVQLLLQQPPLTTSQPRSNAAMARGGGSHKKLKQKLKSKKAKHATLHAAKARSASRRLRRVLRSTHITRKTASRASR